MKSIAQKAERKQRADEKKRARKKEYIVKHAIKHGKSTAARKYQESLSNIKRWCKRYDGTWQSLLNKSRRPHSHPNQHTLSEEADITEVWKKHGCKGMDYVYCVLVKDYAYTRTLWGLFHALRRLGLIYKPKGKGRRSYRQFPACEIPGEKIQIDVKEVPGSCIRGKHRIDGKKFIRKLPTNSSSQGLHGTMARLNAVTAWINDIFTNMSISAIWKNLTTNWQNI